MTLEVEDGFNFAIGQWLGDMVSMAISLLIASAFGAVVVLGVYIYEWICDRRMKE